MLRTPLGEISNIANRRDLRSSKPKASVRVSKGRPVGKDRSDRRPRVDQPMALKLPFTESEYQAQMTEPEYGGFDLYCGYPQGYSQPCQDYSQPCQDFTQYQDGFGQYQDGFGQPMQPCQDFTQYQDSFTQAPYLMDMRMQRQVEPAHVNWQPEVPDRDRRYRSSGDARSRPVRETKPREEREEKDFLYPGHPQYSPIDVHVKNTFINLPAPRTPSPSSRKEDADRTPQVAATCPPKYACSEKERLEWEVAREEAEEAAAVFAGTQLREQKAPPSDLASVGSLLHRAGLCKPCAWFHHAKGCQRGVKCEFCHCCPAGEIKRRKKEKSVQIRKRRSAPHAQW